MPGRQALLQQLRLPGRTPVQREGPARVPMRPLRSLAAKQAMACVVTALAVLVEACTADDTPSEGPGDAAAPDAAAPPDASAAPDGLAMPSVTPPAHDGGACDGSV